MARFILDINSPNGELSEEEVMQIQTDLLYHIVAKGIGNGIATIYPLDLTNGNQFMENEEDNFLTEQQINEYHRQIGYKNERNKI